MPLVINGVVSRDNAEEELRLPRNTYNAQIYVGKADEDDLLFLLEQDMREHQQDGDWNGAIFDIEFRLMYGKPTPVFPCH